MPPAPNGARTSYGPSFAPGPSDINSPGDVRSMSNAAWAGAIVPDTEAGPYSLLPRCYHLLRSERVSADLVLGLLRVGRATWAFRDQAPPRSGSQSGGRGFDPPRHQLQRCHLERREEAA